MSCIRSRDAFLRVLPFRDISENLFENLKFLKIIQAGTLVKSGFFYN